MMHVRFLGIVLVCVLGTRGAPEKKDHNINMNPEFNKLLKKGPQKIEARIGEWMELTCPQFDPDTPDKDLITFELYDLDEESYNRCDIEGKTVILNCSSPYSETKLTLKFQRRTPYPLGFTFQDGKTYYYLAIPIGQKNCDDAMRLEVSMMKEKPYVPNLDPVHEEKEETTSKTTTTTTKRTTTTRSTRHPKFTKTPKEKSVRPSAHQIDDGGNGASSVQNLSMMTSLLAFLVFWRNL